MKSAKHLNWERPKSNDWNLEKIREFICICARQLLQNIVSNKTAKDFPTGLFQALH